MADAFVLPRIAADSHVTLHYRIAVIVDGAEREVASTFEARPATLTVGQGVLAEPLERLLIGLSEGERREFELAAGQAYGERSPDLVQTLTRAVFDAHAEPGADGAAGEVVRLVSEGRQVSGVVKQRVDDRVVVDFNHPLAGLPVRFKVQIVGVL